MIVCSILVGRSNPVKIGATTTALNCRKDGYDIKQAICAQLQVSPRIWVTYNRDIYDIKQLFVHSYEYRRELEWSTIIERTITSDGNRL